LTAAENKVEQGGKVKHGVLIYPFGDSDIAYNDEEVFPRGQNFVAHLQCVNNCLSQECEKLCLLEKANGMPLGLDLSKTREELRKTSRESNRKMQEYVIEKVSFPILHPVLCWLIDSEREIDTWTLFPILTSQSPPHPQDTASLLPLLEAYIEKVNGCLGKKLLELGEPLLLTTNPSDYDSVPQAYAKFRQRLERKLQEADAVLFHITTGTPAMSFAAAEVFATDPRIQFIYKPRTEPLRLVYVNVFLNRVKGTTLEKVCGMLSRFEYNGARDILRSSESGFTSEEVSTSLLLLESLAAWQNHDFEDCCRLLKHELLKQKIELESFRAMCQCLAQPARKSVEFWLAVLKDALARIEMSTWRSDYSGVMNALFNYTEVYMIMMLTCLIPGVDFSRGKVQGDALSELYREMRRQQLPARYPITNRSERFLFLYALLKSEKYSSRNDLVKSFRLFEALWWLEDTRIVPKRNQLVHSSVPVQRKFFDNICKKFILELREGEGIWVVLNMVYKIHRTISGASLPDILGIPEIAWESLPHKGFSSLVSKSPEVEEKAEKMLDKLGNKVRTRHPKAYLPMRIN
jgi:hypothetical protein